MENTNKKKAAGRGMKSGKKSRPLLSWPPSSSVPSTVSVGLTLVEAEIIREALWKMEPTDERSLAFAMRIAFKFEQAITTVLKKKRA